MLQLHVLMIHFSHQQCAQAIEWTESTIRIGASNLKDEVRMKWIDQFAEQVSSWAGISVHPHRFGGREFQFGDAEIGHVHSNGIVDIPFPRAIRDALIEEHLTEEHHWVPNSGWTTFRMRRELDVEHALWLMRLSYLRYQLRTAVNADGILEAQTEQLHLSPRFKSLLKPFVRKSTDQPSVPHVSAAQQKG